MRTGLYEDRRPLTDLCYDLSQADTNTPTSTFSFLLTDPPTILWSACLDVWFFVLSLSSCGGRLQHPPQLDLLYSARSGTKMAKDFSHLNGHSFTPGSIPYVTFQDSSQDPYVLEEAERLLSQFTSSSPHGPGSALVTHGNTAFQLGGEPLSGHSAISSAPQPSSHNPPPPQVPTPTPPQQYDQAHATFSRRPKHPTSLVKGGTVSNASKSEALKPQPREPVHKTPSMPVMYVRRSSRSRNGPSNYYDARYYWPNAEEDLATSTSQTPTPVSTDCMSLGSMELPNLSTGNSSARRRPNMQKLLYGQELGYYGYREQIYQTSLEFKPWKYWIGASNDVMVLAWSPDGTQFAAGAAAESDPLNMEYNRKNNLLVGNLQTSSLRELAEHWVHRPNGTAASSSAFNDARLFQTVSAIQWFDNRLYTASYDRTVKIWDVDPNRTPSCLQTLRHEKKVEVMARSNRAPHILATGAKSFGLWNTQKGDFTFLSLDRTNIDDLEPSALAWGHTSQTNTYLVGGMSKRPSKEDEMPTHHGRLALWKVCESSTELITSHSQSIFDVKWHPWAPQFIAASSSSDRAQGVAQGTRSMLRLYDLRDKRAINQFPCPAVDVNEVTFCPRAPNYITASCTDGVTYVWDRRHASYDRVLHRLGHGEPLNPINSEMRREVADVGVRVTLWGSTIDQFYSGASDGVVKRWDIRRSSEDVFIENTAILKEGIMSGALSEDKTNFLIGDAAGGIHVLSTGPCSNPENEEFTFKKAPELSEMDRKQGIRTANELLSSGQLVMHEIFGAGQGPHYQGPYARWARAPDTPSDLMKQTRLLPEHEMRQLSVESRQGLTEDAKYVIERHVNLGQIRNRRTPPPAISACPAVSPQYQRTVSVGSKTHQRKRRYEDGPRGKLSESKKKKTKTKREKSLEPMITVVHEPIDLTMSSDNEITVVHEPIDLTMDFDNETPPQRTILEDLEDLDLEDDHWWPESRKVDANIKKEDV